ncbi:MAG: hypothetical protein U0136_02595 [Bdellovibrionota bacterium]
MGADIRAFRWVIIFSALVSLGCTADSSEHHNALVKPPLTTDSSKNFKPLRVNEIAVLPLAATPTPGSAVEISTDSLDQAQLDSLQRHTSLGIVNLSHPNEAKAAFAKVQHSAVSIRDRAVAVGQALHVQGVLYGVVTRYEESTGSRYGAEKLAKAGFKLWLVDPQTNTLLWTASYENAEQPLSDNLFRLREKVNTGGVGFRSAMELAKLGFDSVAKELEAKRQAPPTKD